METGAVNKAASLSGEELRELVSTTYISDRAFVRVNMIRALHNRGEKTDEALMDEFISGIERRLKYVLTAKLLG